MCNKIKNVITYGKPCVTKLKTSLRYAPGMNVTWPFIRKNNFIFNFNFLIFFLPSMTKNVVNVYRHKIRDKNLVAIRV